MIINYLIEVLLLSAKVALGGLLWFLLFLLFIAVVVGVGEVIGKVKGKQNE